MKKTKIEKIPFSAFMTPGEIKGMKARTIVSFSLLFVGIVCFFASLQLFPTTIGWINFLLPLFTVTGIVGGALVVTWEG
ncbi:MAG: hypothetical protein Q7T79_01215 [bacterium]|nr:hypothetical protein [bacterium]